MAEILLVRHAQASAFGPTYDALSELGRRQAQALGEHWAGHGVAFARVYLGPRQRHRETCEIVAGRYAARGLPFPAPLALAALDEHHGVRVVKHALNHADRHGDALVSSLPPGVERERALRAFFAEYTAIMRRWARGELGAPDAETWAQFRARAAGALAHLSDGAKGTAVAFTSGGFISAVAGSLLDLDSDRVIDLSLVLRNSSVSEFACSATRRSLVSFNGLPHLTDPALRSVV